MHIAPGTEGIQPMTNINWTLVLMTLIILIAIGTLIYLLVTIIEAMKDINKVLNQALTAQQLQAQTQGQQVQQVQQGHIQNMPAQPAAQTPQTIQTTNTQAAANRHPAPSDKALNEAWKAGYESAKAQYESLQNMTAMPTDSDITNKSANTIDDATNAETVEPTKTIVEDATPVEDTSSATDEARESIDK